MKEFLTGKIGQKLNFIREGYPREVSFDGVLKDIQGNILIIVDAKGNEIAMSLEKILMVGPPDEEKPHNPPGFL